MLGHLNLLFGLGWVQHGAAQGAAPGARALEEAMSTSEAEAAGRRKSPAELWGFVLRPCPVAEREGKAKAFASPSGLAGTGSEASKQSQLGTAKRGPASQRDFEQTFRGDPWAEVLARLNHTGWAYDGERHGVVVHLRGRTPGDAEGRSRLFA